MAGYSRQTDVSRCLIAVTLDYAIVRGGLKQAGVVAKANQK